MFAGSMALHCSDHRYRCKPLVAKLEPDAVAIMRYASEMIANWVKAALEHADMNNAELARQLTERLGRSIDRAAVQKMQMVEATEKTKPRAVAADEMIAISEITGLPIPAAMASQKFTVMVVGYVGAGAEVIPFDDHELGAGLEEVEVPFPIRPDTVAAIVKGDSQLPIFEDGDLIGFGGEPADAMDLIGKRCIVKLMDGRTLIKTLKRGAVPGLFTLASANARDIEDVEIEWARRYRFHIPADEWRAARR